MRIRLERILSIFIIASLTASMCGCSNNRQNAAGSEPLLNKYKDFITVDVFCVDANYEGLQTGWFAKVVKDKFNMQLNIISPNVSGGGDTLFFSRSIAGNLGDIVIFNLGNGRLQDAVTAGLLYDITDQVNNSKILSSYPEAIKKSKKLVSNNKVYAIPGEVSSQSGNEPAELIELVFGTFLRWDYYLEEGAPELNTLEDLLPLLKSMQEKHPLSESGETAYAFSLFRDWDDNMMNLAQQPARMYGYSELGFVLHKVDGSDYDNIIEDDSIYVRGLKFFFEANRLGILDPESTTQNWDKLWNKYVDGAVYFSPWSYQGSSAYNTAEHSAFGKGIKHVVVNDMKLISHAASPAGGLLAVGIGSRAQDKERMFDFIEWLYSPEGIMENCGANGGAAGPEGLTWEYIDGECKLTDFGKQVFADAEGTQMPEEWGGGTWFSGISALNFKAVRESDINEETGECYGYSVWPSYQRDNSNVLDRSWQEYYKADTMVELVKRNGTYLIEPGTDYITPTESINITTIRNQCSDIIVAYSWRMIFAKEESLFYQLLAEMQTIVKTLGYDEVLAFDMECARELNQARDAARSQ